MIDWRADAMSKEEVSKKLEPAKAKSKGLIVTGPDKKLVEADKLFPKPTGKIPANGLTAWIALLPGNKTIKVSYPKAHKRLQFYLGRVWLRRKYFEMGLV